MPRGIPKSGVRAPRRNTAGVNTTQAQEKYRPKNLEGPAPVVGASAFPETPEMRKPTESDVVEYRDPTHDEFYLSPEECKAYGIRDNEQYVWIRDPNYWANKVPGDRVRQFQRENAGGRVIMENGQFVTNGVDLILATRPMSEVEKMRARDRRIEEEHWKEGEKQRRSDDFDSSDKERLMYQKMMNSEENRRAGLIGPQSPSSGLAYEDYVKWRGLTEADIEAEERSYSMLPERTSRELDETQAAERARANQREQRRGGDGKFISIPPNVRPRNLMKGA